MKKIGIITLFGYNNYGNRLQMFAVQKVYKSLGFDSEVIKYEHETLKDPFIIRVKVQIKYILSLKSNVTTALLKKQRVSNFKKHALLYYNESSEFVDPLQVNGDLHTNYSFFSVGSDQIWGWFTHSISDFVFLKFAPEEKRITFSPSFGSSSLDEEYREMFSRGLDGFKNISVREESGAKLVKNLTHKEATVLCDPTMCLSKEEWIGFASIHSKKPKGKYILTYFLGDQSAKVETLLSELSCAYEIVNLHSLESPQFYAITPSEWVDYIKSASLFLTDSFHGVVFSLILQTPFAVYSRVGGESMQTRITNILEKFNLEDRFEIDSHDNSLFNMDFSATEEIINIEKAKTVNFLESSIGLKDI